MKRTNRTQDATSGSSNAQHHGHYSGILDKGEYDVSWHAELHECENCVRADIRRKEDWYVRLNGSEETIFNGKSAYQKRRIVLSGEWKL